MTEADAFMAKVDELNKYVLVDVTDTVHLSHPLDINASQQALQAVVEHTGQLKNLLAKVELIKQEQRLLDSSQESAHDAAEEVRRPSDANQHGHPTCRAQEGVGGETGHNWQGHRRNPCKIPPSSPIPSDGGGKCSHCRIIKAKVDEANQLLVEIQTWIRELPSNSKEATEKEPLQNVLGQLNSQLEDQLTLLYSAINAEKELIGLKNSIVDRLHLSANSAKLL